MVDPEMYDVPLPPEFGQLIAVCFPLCEYVLNTTFLPLQSQWGYPLVSYDQLDVAATGLLAVGW